MPSNYSVLVAVMLSESAEVSMNFTETIILLQRHMAHAGSLAVPAQIEFFNSVKDALTMFTESKHERLFLIDGDMGCDVPFILKNHPYPVVVASYPMRAINWERISSYIMTQRESGKLPDPDTARSEGCIFNFDPASATCVTDTYLPIKKAQAKIVNIGKDGIDLFLKAYDETSKSIVSAGNNDIVVDLSTHGKNPGPFDFVGVVGKRLLKNADEASGTTTVEKPLTPVYVDATTGNVETCTIQKDKEASVPAQVDSTPIQCANGHTDISSITYK